MPLPVNHLGKKCVQKAITRAVIQRGQDAHAVMLHCSKPGVTNCGTAVLTDVDGPFMPYRYQALLALGKVDISRPAGLTVAIAWGKRRRTARGRVQCRTLPPSCVPCTSNETLCVGR